MSGASASATPSASPTATGSQSPSDTRGTPGASGSPSPSTSPTVPVPTSSKSASPTPKPSPALKVTEKPDCPKRSGHTTTFCFEFGLDETSWYWKDQTDQKVPGTGQRLRLPNPQSDDTLPVATKRGSYDRVSAISFDLIAHGVPKGARITRLVLTMEE